MDNLLHDLRYAVRALGKNPGFTAVVVLTLGLGIGANAAMYSVMRGLVLRPPAVADPAGLVVITARNQSTSQVFDWSYADLADFASSPTPFTDLIAYYPGALSVSAGGHTERLWGELVSPNYFSALRVRPVLGRAFTTEEMSAPGAAPVVVLSDGTWRRRFNANPHIVGRSVRLNGHEFTIVGVAPAGFSGLYYPGFQPELWAPATFYDFLVPSAPGTLRQRSATTFRLAARLRPGVTLAQARDGATLIGHHLAQDFPAIYQGIEPSVQTLADARPEPGDNTSARLLVGVFLGGVGLVLLIACVNVAGLLLARATARRRELAIRVAIGASRGRLVRQLLVEAAVLAVAGGVAGVLLAVWATGTLAATLHLPTDIPFAWDFHLDASALGYALGLTTATALLFGLVPTLHTVSPHIANGLKIDAPDARGLRSGRLRGALVVGQIALSSLLLVAAGLAVRTLRAVHRVNPGFEVGGALTGTVAPSLLGYDAARQTHFYRRLVEDAAAIPGVRSATVVRYLPLDFSASGGGLFVDGEDVGPQGGAPVWWSVIGPDYFATVGTPLVAGRDFTRGDSAAAPLVAIASEAAARRFWPNADPVGRLVHLNAPGAPPVRIVGIARDVKVRQLTEPPQPYFYLPLAQNPVQDVSVVVRTVGAPQRVETALREAVARIDPDVPLAGVRTLEAMVAGRALLLPRLGAQFAAVFAVLALSLAVIGLYGVISYSVGRRAREIGIRMALGAGRPAVVVMVVRQGLGLAGLGLGLGIAAALAVTRLLAGVLYGVHPADAATYVVVASFVAVVAVAACFLPARRAARIDPLLALRAE